MSIKLTPAQKELLEYSVKNHDGRLRGWGTTERTISKLAEAGLIEKRPHYTEVERAEFAKQQGECIASATEELNKGNWQDALADLRRADGLRMFITKMSWHVTLKGEELL